MDSEDGRICAGPDKAQDGVRMKTFIFDLDGVIVFTDKLHYQAWKKMADRIGVYFDEKINNRLRGVSRMASLDIILERSEKQYSAAEKESLAEEKNAYYRDLLKTMTPQDVDPAVRRALTQLRERGHRLAIGSSSKNTRFILMQTELLDAFDAISDGTNITKSKPDPEVFLKAAAFAGDVPENCIVVEDALAGIDAAKAAGMLAAGIGEAEHYELTDYPLKAFEDILKIDCF